ncbi:putative thioredoxin [Besnoitia besnoiti]|uniref:Putative thioredoxin n=1 Tax=Besnoitia besnoiti TaxID=94643 RepID=A0A2A9MHH4_BESBE|nr:putative thioredoxin [Besnoitia besnoiti]PFH34870.1 putative thioredoxin [Besnoitia besnoiti]
MKRVTLRSASSRASLVSLSSSSLSSLCSLRAPAAHPARLSPFAASASVEARFPLLLAAGAVARRGVQIRLASGQSLFASRESLFAGTWARRAGRRFLSSADSAKSSTSAQETQAKPEAAPAAEGLEGEAAQPVLEGGEAAKAEPHRGAAFSKWARRVAYSSLLFVGGGFTFLFFAFPATPGGDRFASTVEAVAALLEIRRGENQLEKEKKGRERAKDTSPFAFLAGGRTQEDPLADFSLVTDAEFDRTDEALVLFVDGEKEAEAERENIRSLKSLVERLQAEGKLSKNIRLFYAWRTAANSPCRGEGPAVMLYKGQRRSRHPLESLLDAGSAKQAAEKQSGGAEPRADSDVAQGKEERVLETFFVPMSEPENKARTKREKEKHLPLRVVGANFQRDVLDEAKGGKTIILQLFEDSCFLCFLMRPFINSVSMLLAEYEVPVTLKRLNIEKNDFPEGCPVTRATPTFVLYRAGQEEGEKWMEFRPKDFIEKLEKEFDIPIELRLKFSSLLDRLHERFRRFGLLSVWLLEVRKVEDVLLAAQQRTDAREQLERHGLGSHVEPSGASSPTAETARRAEAAGVQKEGDGDAKGDAEGDADKKKKDDLEFDAVVSMLMSQDMKREDDLEENLKHLEREVANAEGDAMAFGVMLGEEILRADVEHIVDALLETEGRASQPAPSADAAEKQIPKF